MDQRGLSCEGAVLAELNLDPPTARVSRETSVSNDLPAAGGRINTKVTTGLKIIA